MVSGRIDARKELNEIYQARQRIRLCTADEEGPGTKRVRAQRASVALPVTAYDHFLARIQCNSMAFMSRDTTLECRTITGLNVSWFMQFVQNNYTRSTPTIPRPIDVAPHKRSAASMNIRDTHKSSALNRRSYLCTAWTALMGLMNAPFFASHTHDEHCAKGCLFQDGTKPLFQAECKSLSSMFVPSRFLPLLLQLSEKKVKLGPEHRDFVRYMVRTEMASELFYYHQPPTSKAFFSELHIETLVDAILRLGPETAAKLAPSNESLVLALNGTDPRGRPTVHTEDGSMPAHWVKRVAEKLVPPNVQLVAMYAVYTHALLESTVLPPLKMLTDFVPHFGKLFQRFSVEQLRFCPPFTYQQHVSEYAWVFHELGTRLLLLYKRDYEFRRTCPEVEEYRYFQRPVNCFPGSSVDEFILHSSVMEVFTDARDDESDLSVITFPAKPVYVDLEKRLQTLWRTRQRDPQQIHDIWVRFTRQVASFYRRSSDSVTSTRRVFHQRKSAQEIVNNIRYKATHQGWAEEVARTMETNTEAFTLFLSYLFPNARQQDDMFYCALPQPDFAGDVFVRPGAASPSTDT